MRQERIYKRPLRRSNGGGGNPEPYPVPLRPDSARRAIQKSDELMRRIDRMTRASVEIDPMIVAAAVPNNEVNLEIAESGVQELGSTAVTLEQIETAQAAVYAA